LFVQDVKNGSNLIALSQIRDFSSIDKEKENQETKLNQEKRRSKKKDNKS